MQSRILRDLLVAPNNSAPQAATPSFFGQNPINFSSAQAMPQFCPPVEATQLSSSFLLSTPIGLTPMPSPTLMSSPLSLSQLLPAHALPVHPFPAHSLPPLPMNQLPSASLTSPQELQPAPQILGLLNLMQMVQGQNLKAPIEQQVHSSTQSPVSRVIHAESSSQTEGPSFVERAVSPTPPVGVVSMEEEMQTLKNDKEQLQENYKNQLLEQERRMNEGHQKKVTKMSEAMKLLEDDFKKLSSADKKTIGDLKRDGSQQDAQIDVLVQKNKQLEAENKKLGNENAIMKIQVYGLQRSNELQILYVQTDIEPLLDENYQLVQMNDSLVLENKEKNQELLRRQSELADLTRKLQAQEEELQELRDFKIKAEADKKEAQRQLEMTHSNVVTANIPLKKSESPAYNPGFEDDGYLHEETVYTEMPEEIAKMPKEEKFTEVLEKQKDDNELWINRNETELMEKQSLEGLRQERLVLVGHIRQFQKMMDTLRPECSALEEKISSMRSSFQKLQFLEDAKRAEVSNLQRQAKGISDINELQQMQGRYQKMIKIYEDHSEKILIFNNGRYYWRGKQGQHGTSDQQRAAKRPRQ